jgi:hypothetical protein
MIGSRHDCPPFPWLTLSEIASACSESSQYPPGKNCLSIQKTGSVDSTKSSNCQRRQQWDFPLWKRGIEGDFPNDPNRNPPCPPFSKGGKCGTPENPQPLQRGEANRAPRALQCSEGGDMDPAQPRRRGNPRTEFVAFVHGGCPAHAEPRPSEARVFVRWKGCSADSARRTSPQCVTVIPNRSPARWQQHLAAGPLVQPTRSVLHPHALVSDLLERRGTLHQGFQVRLV